MNNNKGAAQTGVQRKRVSIFRRKLADFSFLVPALALFIMIIIIPFFEGVRLSFTNWNGIRPTYSYVGFQNYIRLFTDKTFSNATVNTVVFTIIATIFPNILGLILALLLQKSTRFNNFCRTIAFMPYCLSLVLVSFTWRYIYSDVFYGIFGVSNPLSSSTWVMVGISFICVWAPTGYCMVIYIAGLQGIPADYYEVAQIEGASPWQTFKHVTLPLIVPSITTNFTLLIGWNMKVFDYPMAATGGGPGRSAETVAMLIYNNLFKYYKAGYGQAMAVVFTVAVFIISGLTAWFFRSKEVEM